MILILLFVLLPCILSSLSQREAGWILHSYRPENRPIPPPKHDPLRPLVNLEAISKCELGFPALAYNSHGCWCGIGGAHEPIDHIDRCCKVHDACYKAAVADKVCSKPAWEYVDDYTWTCRNGTSTCNEYQTDCKMALCQCDKAVVSCWKQVPRPPKKIRCDEKKAHKWSRKFFYFHH